MQRQLRSASLQRMNWWRGLLCFALTAIMGSMRIMRESGLWSIRFVLLRSVIVFVIASLVPSAHLPLYLLLLSIGMDVWFRDIPITWIYRSKCYLNLFHRTLEQSCFSMYISLSYLTAHRWCQKHKKKYIPPQHSLLQPTYRCRICISKR